MAKSQPIPSNGGALITQTQILKHSGPLPSPDTLRDYEFVLPGAAERIVRMAETEQKQRHAREHLAIVEASDYGRRGQWMAFLLSCSSIGIGTWLAFEGFELLAGVLFGTTLVGLAAAFLSSRQRNASRPPA